jgi:DNA-directed RNA polymerase beta subunit
MIFKSNFSINRTKVLFGQSKKLSNEFLNLSTPEKKYLHLSRLNTFSLRTLSTLNAFGAGSYNSQNAISRIQNSDFVFKQTRRKVFGKKRFKTSFLDTQLQSQKNSQSRVQKHFMALGTWTTRVDKQYSLEAPTVLTLPKFIFLKNNLFFRKIKHNLAMHPQNYFLDKYHRSNQDTCLVHKPSVKVGEWVESGDLLADNSASMNGELAIGKNIIVAYMPWEGFNYEDAILINERLVYDDVYTSIHIERYEIETKTGQLGGEHITRDIPDINPETISHLDKYGIASVGSWIEEGDILVGKVTPINKKAQTPYQRLLFKLLDKKMNSVRDTSLRAPKGIKANIIHVQIISVTSDENLNLKTKSLKKKVSTKQKKAINHSKTFAFINNMPNAMSKKTKQVMFTTKKLQQLIFNNSKLLNQKCLLPKFWFDLITLAQSSNLFVRQNLKKTKSFKRILPFIINFICKNASNGNSKLPNILMDLGPWQKARIKKYLTYFPLIHNPNFLRTNDTYYYQQLTRPNSAYNKWLKASKLKVLYSPRDMSILFTENSLNTNLLKPKKISQYVKEPFYKSKSLKTENTYQIKISGCLDPFDVCRVKGNLFSRKKTKSKQTNIVHGGAAYNNLQKLQRIVIHNQRSKQKVFDTQRWPWLKKEKILLGPGMPSKNQNLIIFNRKVEKPLAFRKLKTKYKTAPSTRFQQKPLNRLSGLFVHHKKALLTNQPSAMAKDHYASPTSNKIIPTTVHIYLAEKRKIQIGDKMAGRHGNKGIISNILPRQDMPFLPDGTAVDIVLNPLGVPSRMNVGQIYECLLGLAGKYLGEHYKIFPFDEIYGAEASRSFVFAKLFEASKKTGFEWLFDANSPGKIRLLDGRTGECFDQPITVGIAYMLKLVHMVDDKIHARSTGPYSLVTQQPLRGRAKQGGQRLGEMEVWAIEGYGAAFVLLEMLTLKSDDMTGRLTLWSNLILNKEILIGTPESFKVLVCELQALCLDIGLFVKANNHSNPPNSATQLKEISHLMLLP